MHDAVLSTVHVQVTYGRLELKNLIKWDFVTALMIFSVQDVLQSIHELRFRPHTLYSYATLFIAQQQELFDCLQSGLQQVLIKLYCVRYTLHLKHPFRTIVQKGCFK